MAQIQKFKKTAIVNQLRHVDREIKYPKNTDIDPERTKNNYALSPDRGMTGYEYFKERLSQLYYRDQEDIKLLAGWVITAPKELETDEEIDTFFSACYKFLAERYGEENCIRATVHKDESGRPHIHFDFIPVVKNENQFCEHVRKAHALKSANPDLTYREMAEILHTSKSAVHKWIHTEIPSDEKVSAHEVLNRKELKAFHPDLQKYLIKNGVKGRVITGITKAQGGNMTVEQLKAQRNYLLEHGADISEIIKCMDVAISMVEADAAIDERTITDKIYGIETIDFT